MTLAEKIKAAAQKENHSKDDVQKIVQRVTGGVTKTFDAEAMAAVNDLLGQRHRRPLTVDEVATILAIHLSSIWTRNGESPGARVIGFFSDSGRPIDRAHVAIVTDALMAADWLRVTKAHNTATHKAATYEILDNKLKQIMESLFRVASTHMKE